MNKLSNDEIPVLTDIAEPNIGSASAFINDTSRFLGELEAHLTAVIHEQADELVHNALREMEGLLLEQVSDRLKAELPRLISRVIAEHFTGPGLAN
ncbi:MAG: hypothetical protein WBM03_11180 [Steroidobacteraceae bacterium]